MSAVLVTSFCQFAVSINIIKTVFHILNDFPQATPITIAVSSVFTLSVCKLEKTVFCNNTIYSDTDLGLSLALVLYRL